MTKINVKVVADSKNEFGNRIVSVVMTYPRIIHAELMTHRMFSRNAASSRAVPFVKLVKSIKEDPFIPIAFQKDHKGMQGTEYFTGQDEIKIRNAWCDMRWRAVEEAEKFAELGVTKQLCNRPLEPFQYYSTLVTATEWENFFALRCPKYEIKDGKEIFTFRSWKDAVQTCIERSERVTNEQFYVLQNTPILERLYKNKGQADIHMMALAEAMWDAYNESTPKELKAGEWHIPFGEHQMGLPDGSYSLSYLDELKVKVATARCARISYTVVGEEDKIKCKECGGDGIYIDGDNNRSECPICEKGLISKPVNYENDIKLHDRLAASGHWSPFEHCAKAMSKDEYYSNVNGFAPMIVQKGAGSAEFNIGTNSDKAFGWSGNFRGFTQYRKTFNNENITK